MTVKRALDGAKLVVVGAGVVGSAVAYRLSQAGATVTVIDDGIGRKGASANSFGWVNGFNKYPVDYYRLNVASIREHKELQDEVGASWMFTPGSLHWSAGGQAGFTTDLERTVRQMKSWGARIYEYSAEEVCKRMEPGLFLAKDVDRVFWFAEEGWAYPAVMIGALLTRAQQDYGLTVTEGRVVGFTGGEGNIDGVRLEGGAAVHADLVVLAAGLNTGELAKLAGGTVPMESSPGCLLVTEPVTRSLTHLLVGPDVFVRPDGGGRLRFSSEALLGRHLLGDPSSDRDVRAAVNALSALLPGAASVQLEGVHNGVRPIPSDGYPVMGFDKDVDGLYYVFAHSGVTLSAILAKNVVQHLHDMSGLDMPDEEYLRFSPSRFGDGSFDLLGPSAE